MNVVKECILSQARKDQQSILDMCDADKRGRGGTPDSMARNLSVGIVQNWYQREVAPYESESLYLV